MVQMTRPALQALINRVIIQNTTGAITASVLNDVLTDIVDSVDILASGALAPQIRSFSISGQATAVDPDTSLSGTKTFIWNITEEDNVSGNLTLTQGVSTLSSTIDPKAGTADIAINSVTLAAGEEVVFTLSGTDTFSGNFSRTFTVAARALDDYLYYSLEADNDPSDVVVANANRTPFGGTQQSFTLPTFTGNRFLTILQKATEPAISQIFVDGLNQFDAFTKTSAALNISGASFDAYVSTNSLIGSVASGDQITIVR